MYDESQFATEEEVIEMIQAHREQKAQNELIQNANREIADFQSNNPDVDLEALNNDPKFVKFLEGRRTGLQKSYEDYLDLIGEPNTAPANNFPTKSEPKKHAFDSAKGLTAEEKAIVDDYNRRYGSRGSRMTYREFAERKQGHKGV